MRAYKLLLSCVTVSVLMMLLSSKQASAATTMASRPNGMIHTSPYSSYPYAPSEPDDAVTAVAVQGAEAEPRRAAAPATIPAPTPYPAIPTATPVPTIGRPTQSIMLTGGSTGGLYGLSPRLDGRHLVAIDPATGNETTVGILPLYDINAFISTLDPVNHRYFYVGLDGSRASRLYVVDTATGDLVENPVVAEGLHHIEFDVSTGTLYGLSPRSDGRHLVAIDPATGSETTVGVLPLYGIKGGVSTLDSIGHRYFYVGLDGSRAYRLYVVDTATGDLVENPVVAEGLHHIEYDVSTGTLYGLSPRSDGRYLVAIDPATGSETTVGVLPLYDIKAAVSTLDPIGHRYFYVGHDGSRAHRLYVVDTATGDLVENPVVTEGLHHIEYEALPVVQLSISKEDRHDPWYIGQSLGYDIHITNTGTVNLTGVVITDHIPLPWTYLPGIDSGLPHRVWEVGDLAADEARHFEFEVQSFADAPPGTVITNTVEGIALELDVAVVYTETTLLLASHTTPTSVPTSMPTATPSPTPTPPPVEVCYCSTPGEMVYRIDASSFRGYATDSASESPLIHVTSPPAPAGWNEPGFVPDDSWQPGAAVWWDVWENWRPLIPDCTIIGLLDQHDKPEERDGTTHLHRRVFTLSSPEPSMEVTRAVLRMWSDNKTAWWWEGELIADDRERYIGEVELFPAHLDRQGGTYLLAIQNSNDYMQQWNPHGTAFQLCVTWAWLGTYHYRIDLPLVMMRYRER